MYPRLNNKYIYWYDNQFWKNLTITTCATDICSPVNFADTLVVKIAMTNVAGDPYFFFYQNSILGGTTSYVTGRAVAYGNQAK